MVRALFCTHNEHRCSLLLCLLCLLFCASAVSGASTRAAKSDIPPETVYEDEANTFSSSQTFNAGVTVSPTITFVESGTPGANPPAGAQSLFVDSADSKLKLLNSFGEVSPVGSPGGSSVTYIPLNLTPIKDIQAVKSPAPANVVITTTSNSVKLSAYAFDPSTEEFMVFHAKLPSYFEEGEAVKINFAWSCNTGSTNSVVWKLYHTARAATESLDVAMSTATVTSAGGSSADTLRVGTISVTGSSLGWADNDTLTLQISRDATNGSDNLAYDANLIAFTIDIPVTAGASGEIALAADEGSTSVETDVRKLKFDSDDFDLTSQSNGQVDVALASSVGSGKVIQEVRDMLQTSGSTTNYFPPDTSKPQFSEGAALLEASITPTSSSSILRVVVSATLGPGSSTYNVVLALFRDGSSNSDAIACTTEYFTPATSGPLSLVYYCTAGSTSQTTFSVRYGGVEAYAVHYNKRGAVDNFGSTLTSTLIVTELSP